MFSVWWILQNCVSPYFLSTGGTSTGAPVCLSANLCLQKKNQNRFRDYLTLRYFPQRVVSVFVIAKTLVKRLCKPKYHPGYFK